MVCVDLRNTFYNYTFGLIKEYIRRYRLSTFLTYAPGEVTCFHLYMCYTGTL